MHTYGTLPTTPVNTRVEYVATTAFLANGTVVEKYKCNWSDRASKTPAINSLYPANSNYFLKNAEQVQLDAGLCEITLTWATDFELLPDPTIVEQTAMEQVAIQEHPHFSNWLGDWDGTAFKQGSTKYGIISYVKGTTTVTKTEYFYNQPTSRMLDIGYLEYPGGSLPGDVTKWLIIGSTRQQQGLFWTRQTTYLFSAQPFNSDIYTQVGT